MSKVKIKGMETPKSFAYKQVEDWIDTCGLVNKHFIDHGKLFSMVMRCVKHGQKFSNHLRKTRCQNKK